VLFGLLLLLLQHVGHGGVGANWELVRLPRAAARRLLDIVPGMAG
jgi:hypothetical protein